MGNSKSKKAQKEPDKFFEREKWREQRREEIKKKNLKAANKRTGIEQLPPGLAATSIAATSPRSGGALQSPPQPPTMRTYDDEALERMRFQLQNDSDAFLLNNILLSVQFFENFEREMAHLKTNPISDRDHAMDEAMVKHHKHVFFADQVQECVFEHVRYLPNRGTPEPLASSRLFIIYDNIEACEPGDTSDYSAVLDAPFYKLQMEDSKETGYVKLRQLEILESTVKQNENDVKETLRKISIDSVYTDSEKESNDSDDETFPNGEAFLEKIKSRLNETRINEPGETHKPIKLNQRIDLSERRRSGPIKPVSSLVEKNNITNIKKITTFVDPLSEENEKRLSKMDIPSISIDQKEEIITTKPRKSILKLNMRRLSGPVKETNFKILSANNNTKNKGSEDSLYNEDTETSGYRSNSSSRHNESSENESEYGYSTITESATPKQIELSRLSRFSPGSGILPDECWNTVRLRVDDWSDEEDNEDDDDDVQSKESVKNLYDVCNYLNSVSFMTNFVDSFMMKLGADLGLSQEAISNSLTQGASIYCKYLKNETCHSSEIIPALIAAWPNAANQWIIRERRIIQNPRTNFTYQWPTKYMVSKAIGLGCLLVPVGFRPKRGINGEQQIQWRITFPAAERYLESCLAHSHIRCYLFTLALQRHFMENETSKIGLDANHIKNHLFWQCEENYAKWPEDRLGETLRIFLKSLYIHFGHSKMPNYFIENCNDFKSIPKPLLLKLQRKLADILEAPVTHILDAINKLRYTKKDYYPQLNVKKLYHILTCKNPLRLLNPNLPPPTAIIEKDDFSSGSEDESFDGHGNFWERTKAQDKNYQWKKEKQKQVQQRRLNIVNNKKLMTSARYDNEIKKMILPKKMDVERRRLVLDFFIPHFIAMARTSEKFGSIKQAIIYLEQANRLCTLLSEEAVSEMTAKEYFYVIRDKLADCQRKLVNEGGFKLPPRRESRVNLQIRKQRPKYQEIVNQASPNDINAPAFVFVDVHGEPSSSAPRVKETKRDEYEDEDSEEDSKL